MFYVVSRLFICFVLFCLVFSFGFGAENIDPFSKITVTSQNAIFEREKKGSSLFRLMYSENVNVVFADSSTVSSDTLEIFMNSEKEKDSTSSQLKKVIFKKNVVLTRKNHNIYADNIELAIEKKICKLSGNVKIRQIKQREKDIPFMTECEEALLKWEDEQVTLVGNKQQPVCTTIEVGERLQRPERLRKKLEEKEKNKQNKVRKRKKFVRKK